jgi:tetratricopeptide (TPR) repeat protein
MMRKFRISAVLIFFSVPTFLFSQIADTNSPNPKGMAALTGSAALNGQAPEHLSEPLREPQPDRGTVETGAVASSLWSDLSSTGDPRFTVSVSSLAAPGKAQKAFQKGQEYERKGKFEAACDYFKKAVAIYPRYALAWLELGRFQARRSNFTDAQESFRHAVASDSNLATGYVDFAIVSAQQNNWQAMAEMTDTLVQRFPDSSPVYWFLNSAAYYNLGKMKEAQSSITRALRLDPRHQLPQLEYLYGLILGRQKQIVGAANRQLQESNDPPSAPQDSGHISATSQMADDEQH